MKFEDKLLTELKAVAVQTPQTVAHRSRRWRVRLAAASAIAAAIATAAVVLPSGGRGPGVRPAYAVTENDDGTVTVEIRSLRNQQDADGLERKVESAGVSAAVYYLPQNQACAPPGYEARMRLDASTAGRQEAASEARPSARGAVRVGERDDGVFVFTIDKTKIESDEMVVIFAVDDVPEHGQDAATVTSIQPLVFKGRHYDECRMVDGSMEGWGFQQGAPAGSK